MSRPLARSAVHRTPAAVRKDLGPFASTFAALGPFAAWAASSVGRPSSLSGGTFTDTAGPTYAPAGLAAVITLVNSTGSITGGSFVGQGTQFFAGTAAVIVGTRQCPVH